jgi:hypothetical protein
MATGAEPGDLMVRDGASRLLTMRACMLPFNKERKKKPVSFEPGSEVLAFERPTQSPSKRDN